MIILTYFEYFLTLCPLSPLFLAEKGLHEHYVFLEDIFVFVFLFCLFWIHPLIPEFLLEDRHQLTRSQVSPALSVSLRERLPVYVPSSPPEGGVNRATSSEARSVPSCRPEPQNTRTSRSIRLIGQVPARGRTQLHFRS